MCICIWLSPPWKTNLTKQSAYQASTKRAPDCRDGNAQDSKSPAVPWHAPVATEPRYVGVGVEVHNQHLPQTCTYWWHYATYKRHEAQAQRGLQPHHSPPTTEHAGPHCTKSLSPYDKNTSWCYTVHQTPAPSGCTTDAHTSMLRAILYAESFFGAAIVHNSQNARAFHAPALFLYMDHCQPHDHHGWHRG